MASFTKKKWLKFVSFLTLLIFNVEAYSDNLQSWNEGSAKKSIIEFVENVTKKDSPDFVHPSERIAVFDNDGTLWAEQPLYFQLIFALDRVKALAPKHPEWKTKEPFKSILSGDKKSFEAQGQKAVLEVLAATHAGMTTIEFKSVVKAWIETAEHPKYKKKYKQLVYKPMLEVLDYLRANEFKTFIVSGGGVEFMRVFAEKIYGIPPEQVIGTSGVVKFEVRNKKSVLVKTPKIEFIDDGQGKPVGINRFIGRRPIMAFGNSDGDFEMLQYTTDGEGARFALIVHHTDSDREYAYDRGSKIGKLERGLDQAEARGWVLAVMKKDWKIVFDN